RASDAAIASCDQRHLPFELFRALVERRVVHGRGIEFELLTRLGLMLFWERRLRVIARARLYGPVMLFGVVGFAILAGLDAALFSGRVVGISHTPCPRSFALGTVRSESCSDGRGACFQLSSAIARMTCFRSTGFSKRVTSRNASGMVC